MPNYNGARYIEGAINSISEQSFPDFECLILDDGSTDHSTDIIRNYSSCDTRIILVSLKHEGIVSALNHGLKVAKGEHIARMDSDDLMLPDRLKEQYEYSLKHPDTLIGTNAYLCDPELKKLGKHNPPEGHNDIWNKLLAGMGSAIMHPTLMAKKAVFDRIGGYREAYRHVEDLDLYLRAQVNGVKLTNLVNLYGLKYRLHAQSISNSKAELQMTLKKQLLQELEANHSIEPNWNDLQLSEKMLPKNKSEFYRRWSAIAFSDKRRSIAYKYLLKSLFAKPGNQKNLIEGLRLLKHHLFN